MASAVYCVMFYLFMHLTSAQNVISCPPFTEGTDATIDFNVTKAAFSNPSPCTLPPTSITFYFEPKNGGKATWCTAPYTNCPNTGTPLPACGNCTCGCESDDGTTITFRLYFTPSAAEDGGTFSSDVNCANSGNKPNQTNEDCYQISVASPTSPTSSDQGSDLLWLLLLLLLLIPLLIVITIFCCPCGNIACHCCCCTGRCYCRCADKAEAGGGGSAWCRKEDSFITHVCYLCGYNEVKEEKKEFICYSLEKGEMEATTRSGHRDNKVDADHVATNGSGHRDNKVDADHVATNGPRKGERVSKPVQETELTEVRETSSPPSGEEETSPNGTS